MDDKGCYTPSFRIKQHPLEDAGMFFLYKNGTFGSPKVAEKNYQVTRPKPVVPNIEGTNEDEGMMTKHVKVLLSQLGKIWSFRLMKLLRYFFSKSEV